MSYETNFDGAFKLEPSVTPEHQAEYARYLKSPTNQNAPRCECPWKITPDGCELVEDGYSYRYEEWLQYIINHFFTKLGYKVSGAVSFNGEDVLDRGELLVMDDVVTKKVIDPNALLKQLVADAEATFRPLIFSPCYGEHMQSVQAAKGAIEKLKHLSSELIFCVQNEVPIWWEH